MIHYIVSLGPLQLMKLEGEGYHGPPFFTPIRGCRAGRRWHSHPETEKLVRTPGVGDWTGPGGKMWKKRFFLVDYFQNILHLAQMFAGRI